MPKTLLLADDSVTIQKVVGITFANEDVRLITESNGDAALARAREDMPDLVLADVAMPGLNGYELCAAIKADPRLSHVPVILLTGTFESYDESRTNEVGADGHIAKPFEAQALVDLVHRTLDRAATGEVTPQPVAPAPVLESAPAPTPVPVPATPPAAPTELVTAAAPEPAPAPSDADFSFADFDADLGAGTAQPSGEVTQFYDPAAAKSLEAPSEPPPAALPAAQAPSDAPDPNYDETSFLDPRAALTPDGPAAPEPAAADDVPEIEAPPSSGVPLAPDAAAELDVFEAPNVPDLHTPTDGRAQATGETTWRLTDTPSQPATPNAAALAAEQALDDLADPDAGLRVVRARADETQSDLAWAEPLDDRAATNPIDRPASVETPAAAPAGPPTGDHPTVQIDSKHLQESLEKVAWEAFGPVSEQLVSEALRKIQEVAWEVIPQVAERLVREEIEKLKRES